MLGLANHLSLSLLLQVDTGGGGGLHGMLLLGKGFLITSYLVGVSSREKCWTPGVKETN
jgi:hypothetical protein